MGIFKELWNGEHKSFIRFAVWTFAVFAVYMLFFNRDSMWRWIRAGAEIRSQEAQIERLNREIREMDERIQDLSTDRDSVETYAREHFHFSRPGEDVYIEPE